MFIELYNSQGYKVLINLSNVQTIRPFIFPNEDDELYKEGITISFKVDELIEISEKRVHKVYYASSEHEFFGVTYDELVDLLNPIKRQKTPNQ